MPQIYAQNTDPVDSEIDNFVSLLTKCDVSERVYFMQLFGCVAKRKPKVSRLALLIGRHSMLSRDSQPFICVSYPT